MGVRMLSVSRQDHGADQDLICEVGIPNEFDLILDSDKTPRRCRVEWSNPCLRPSKN